MTFFYFEPSQRDHDTGPGHPECAARLDAVRQAVLTALPDLHERRPTAATREQLERAHAGRLVDMLFEQAPDEGQILVDGDTVMSPATLDAARCAAGAMIDATDALAAGDTQRAFCAVRPPGHHAEYDRAMGFCFFNSVAVAARHALQHHGMERVAILDFDVHHANGTEDIFRDDPQVLLCSTYQHPFYPGLNSPSVEGQRVNVPLPAGTDGATFREAVTERWWPQLDAFNPDLILVSAGFDAHRDDPLGQLLLHDDDYRWLGQTIAERAEALCDGRLIATLEGGYDLAALGRSAAMFCYAMVEG